jgi:cobalt-zinc-cadmium efflux system membrane fusion protein
MREQFAQRKIMLLVGALVIVAATVIGIGRLRTPARAPSAPAKFEVSPEVARTGAGKVGDLTITEEAEQLAGIKIAPADLRVATEQLAVSGVIEAGGDREVKITPRVAGTLTSVAVVVGDAVRAGQTLAMIESPELARAQAEYRQAGARIALARERLQSQRELARLGAFTGPSVEEARRSFSGAQGDLAQAEREVAVAGAEVAKARYEKAAVESEVATVKSEVAAAEGEAASKRGLLTKAKAQVEVQAAALTQAKTEVGVAQSRFERQDALLEKGLVSRQEWERAQADLRRAEAEVQAAQSRVSEARAEVESAESLQDTGHALIRATQARVEASQRRVQQAEASIKAALARQEQAESQLASLRHRGQIAQAALRREEAVYRGNYGATKEIAEATGVLREAEIQRDAAAQAVRLFGGTPGGASRVAIAAPIAGRIRERSASPGETVDTEHPLFSILNLDIVWAQLSVSPKDMQLVREGQRVELRAETAPHRLFHGTVSAVAATADTDTRAVQVRCALVNADRALRPGAFVRGTIATDVARERVTVPLAALQEHFGKPTVYVRLPGQAGGFEVRHVTLGVQGEGWREVTSGLKAGERIAIEGTFYLKSEALKSALSDGCCAPPGAE